MDFWSVFKFLASKKGELHFSVTGDCKNLKLTMIMEKEKLDLKSTLTYFFSIPCFDEVGGERKLLDELARMIRLFDLEAEEFKRFK